jgi:hypothetical protein
MYLAASENQTERKIYMFIVFCLVIFAAALWPKNKFLNPPTGQVKKEFKILWTLIGGGVLLALLLIYLLK